jgi:hypothetical protein
MHASLAKSAKKAIPLHAVPARDLKAWLAKLPYLKAFSAREGLDIAGWTGLPRHSRPLGGEANAARALDALLKERYGR